jgi:hypothetical protein
VGGGAGYGTYVAVGNPIVLDNPDGGVYSFVDPGGLENDNYLLECLTTSGALDNPLYLRCGSAGYSVDYTTQEVDDMRDYNFSKIKKDKWRKIANGEVTVRSVSETGSPECDFLVIAYEDFVQDVAPICDYWEFQGLDVVLAKVDGNVESDIDVKNYIASAANQRPLKGVWLVGSTNPTPFLSVYNPVPTSLSQFDHFYADIDNDGLMDHPVGRLPARAIREVVFYINKELHYHWDTLWGGKKDPTYYSTHQVNVIPNNHACVGCSAPGGYDKMNPAWTESELLVGATGTDIYSALADQVGYEKVKSLLSTSLGSWYNGDDALYHQAIKDSVESDLSNGRHVIFGVSLHNSNSTQYGIINSSSWPAGICIPGGACWRPTDSFWFTPECFATSLYSNMRTSSAEPLALSSASIPAIELFQNRGLLIFGSSGRTWHTTTQQVSIKMAERVLTEDPTTGNNESIGKLWMDIYNEIKAANVTEPAGLSRFGIFGDPMLYVRGVYDSASSVDDVVSRPLVVHESPNPFNGKIQFQISGMLAGGGHAKIYDISGRLVKTLTWPPTSETTVVFWTGKDESERGVSSGIYFVVVSNQGRKISKKIAYIK